MQNRTAASAELSLSRIACQNYCALFILVPSSFLRSLNRTANHRASPCRGALRSRQSSSWSFKVEASREDSERSFHPQPIVKSADVGVAPRAGEGDAEARES